MVKSIMFIAFLTLAVTYIYQQPIVNDKLAPYVAPLSQKLKMLENKINDMIALEEEDEDSTKALPGTATASSKVAAELNDATSVANQVVTQISEALATPKVMPAGEHHLAKMRGSFGKAKDDFLAFCHAYYITYIFYLLDACLVIYAIYAFFYPPRA